MKSDSTETEFQNLNQPQASACRFCYGEDAPLIQPCLCKGSIAYVHPRCLGKWLETTQSLHCGICNYHIQQQMKLKKIRSIFSSLINHLIKRLRREDKFFIFKVVIYSAYIVLSCKKALACYRLLVGKLLRKKSAMGSSRIETVLCVLYLILILF